MPLVDARGFNLQRRDDKSPIFNAVSQLVRDGKANQRQQKIDEQTALQTRLKASAVQLIRVRDMADGKDPKAALLSMRREIARLGSNAIANGEDPQLYINAQNYTTLDELNLFLSAAIVRAGDADEQIKNALKDLVPPKPQTAIAKARSDLGNGLITQEDFNQLSAIPKEKLTSIQQNLIAAGFKPGTKEFQEELLVNIRKNVGTTINVGNQGFKVPAGFMINPDDETGQSVVPIPGSTGGTLSGDGAKLQEIARAGSDVVKQISERIESGEITQETLAAAATPSVFNAFKSGNVQQFEALRNDLQDMLGRLRSGGAITADELGTFSKLLPVFGDQPGTIDLKMKQLGDKFDNIGTKVSLAPIPDDKAKTSRFQIEVVQ